MSYSATKQSTICTYLSEVGISPAVVVLCMHAYCVCVWVLGVFGLVSAPVVLIYPGWVKNALVQTIDFHPPKWLAEGMCEKNRSKWPMGPERSLLPKVKNGRSQSPRPAMAPLLLRPNRLPFQKAQPMSSPYNVRLPIYWREIHIFPVILVKYIYRCNYGQISHYKIVIYIIKWCIYSQIIMYTY